VQINIIKNNYRGKEKIGDLAQEDAQKRRAQQQLRNMYRGGSELIHTSRRSGNHRQHAPATAHNLPMHPLACRACNRVGGIF